MTLILFVLLIGIANLAAGYAVGQWWAPAPMRHALAAVDLSVFNRLPTSGADQTPALSFELPPLAVELPPVKTPAAAVSRPRTFAEAALAEIDDALHAHRERLLAIDEQMIDSQSVESLEAMQDFVDALRRANEQYVETQTPATAHLRERENIGKSLAGPCETFEYQVEDQTAQVEAINRSLATVRLDYDVDLPAIRDGLRHEIARLLDDNAALCDRLGGCALVVAGVESHLDSVDAQFITDRASGLPNRAGVDLQLQLWSAADGQRVRPHSLALFDLSSIGELNAQYGQSTVSRLLVALAGELRAHSGDGDVVARRCGGQFAILFPDTDRRGATAAVERHRQRAAAMKVNIGAAQLGITLSCALTEGQTGDDAHAIWDRLDSALATAKAGEEDQAYGFFADAPEPIAPAELQVDEAVLTI